MFFFYNIPACVKSFSFFRIQPCGQVVLYSIYFYFSIGSRGALASITHDFCRIRFKKFEIIKFDNSPFQLSEISLVTIRIPVLDRFGGGNNDEIRQKFSMSTLDFDLEISFIKHVKEFIKVDSFRSKIIPDNSFMLIIFRPPFRISSFAICVFIFTKNFTSMMCFSNISRTINPINSRFIDTFSFKSIKTTVRNTDLLIIRTVFLAHEGSFTRVNSYFSNSVEIISFSLFSRQAYSYRKDFFSAIINVLSLGANDICKMPLRS